MRKVACSFSMPVVGLPVNISFANFIIPIIQKLDHSKFRCPFFKWFLTKWRLFVWISNGWLSGLQITFKIWTICNPTTFRPFEVHTSPNSRSPLKSSNQKDYLDKVSSVDRQCEPNCPSFADRRQSH